MGKTSSEAPGSTISLKRCHELIDLTSDNDSNQSSKKVSDNFVNMDLEDSN
jgi:hypothetical protein